MVLSGQVCWQPCDHVLFVCTCCRPAEPYGVVNPYPNDENLKEHIRTRLADVRAEMMSIIPSACGMLQVASMANRLHGVDSMHARCWERSQLARILGALPGCRRPNPRPAGCPACL